jgi:hypothetical protein
MEKVWCKQKEMPSVYSQKKNGTTYTFKSFGMDVSIVLHVGGIYLKILSQKPLAEKVY